LLKSKRFWLGIIIMVVCLALAFNGIQFSDLLASFAQMNWTWLPILIAVFLVSYSGRAFRWQALFAPYKPRWLRVFGTLSIGYFLSNITPARLGDLVRPYLLGTLEKIPVARAYSTLVIERALDGLTVVVLLLLLLPFIPHLDQQYVDAGIFLGITGVVLFVVLAIISLRPDLGVNFLRKLASPFKFLDREGLWHFIGNLIDGFSVVRSPRPIALAGFWSLEVWLVASLLAWLTMFSLGINNLPFTAGILIQVATGLAVTFAASPGQLGVFHLVARYVLTTLYGVPPSQALAYAFILHGISYLMLTLLGLISMWREGLDLAKIQEMSGQNSSVKTTAE
jgi:glycosyltransferase 2 family protein